MCPVAMTLMADPSGVEDMAMAVMGGSTRRLAALSPLIEKSDKVEWQRSDTGGDETTAKSPEARLTHTKRADSSMRTFLKKQRSEGQARPRSTTIDR